MSNATATPGQTPSRHQVYSREQINKCLFAYEQARSAKEGALIEYELARQELQRAIPEYNFVDPVIQIVTYPPGYKTWFNRGDTPDASSSISKASEPSRSPAAGAASTVASRHANLSLDHLPPKFRRSKSIESVKSDTASLAESTIEGDSPRPCKTQKLSSGLALASDISLKSTSVSASGGEPVEPPPALRTRPRVYKPLPRRKRAAAAPAMRINSCSSAGLIDRHERNLNRLQTPSN